MLRRRSCQRGNPKGEQFCRNDPVNHLDPWGLEASREELVDGVSRLFEPEAHNRAKAKALAWTGELAAALPEGKARNVANEQGADAEAFMAIWRAGNARYWATVRKQIAAASAQVLEVEAIMFGAVGADKVGFAINATAAALRMTESEEPCEVAKRFVVSELGARMLGKFLEGKVPETAVGVAWDKVVEWTPDLVRAALDNGEVKFYRFKQWGPHLGMRGLWSSKTVDRGLDIAIVYDTKRDVVMASISLLLPDESVARRLTVLYGIYDDDAPELRGERNPKHPVKLQADLEYVR